MRRSNLSGRQWLAPLAVSVALGIAACTTPVGASPAPTATPAPSGMMEHSPAASGMMEASPAASGMMDHSPAASGMMDHSPAASGMMEASPSPSTP